MVILEPWFAPGRPEEGRVYVKTVETGGVSVCRMSHVEVHGRMSRLRFEYLIDRPLAPIMRCYNPPHR